MGQRGRRAAERRHRRSVRRRPGGEVGEPGSPSGARTPRGSAGSGAPRTSRSIRPGSSAGLPMSILRSLDAPPAAIMDDRELFAERVAHDGDEPADAGGDRGRARAKPRAHPADVDPRGDVVRRPRRRSRGADPADPDAARAAHRRARTRVVLPRVGTVRPGDRVQQPAGGAWLRYVAGRRAPRHRPPALHGGGQAARLDPLDRAPRRPRAHVLRVAAAERVAGLDALAAGHDEPARDLLHGRGVRVLPAGGEPAVEDAPADAAEAGPGVRARLPAGDAEPRGPRLQGARQLRHVVAGPPADRARQGPRPRRPRGRGGVGGRPVRSRVLRPGVERAEQPRVRDEQRARGRPGRDRVPLGDVVPPGAAHPRPDQGPHGTAEGRGSALRPARAAGRRAAGR